MPSSAGHDHLVDAVQVALGSLDARAQHLGGRVLEADDQHVTRLAVEQVAA